MRSLETYHLAWLQSHLERDEAWLRAMLKDGFHIHHVDGNHSNDDAANLALMDGVDHMRLHTVNLKTGISSWRKAGRARLRAPTTYPSPPALEEADIGALRSRIG